MASLNKIKPIYIFVALITASSLLLSCVGRKSESPKFTSSENRKSGIAIASVSHENTYIKVVYGQPYRKGRTIFGDWEPYGEVWRTGANEATEITITNTILMNNEAIEAGTYSLFTIPYEDHWTIILNNALGQWGAFDYNTNFDYKRFDVPTIPLNNHVEAFSISFSEVQSSMTSLILEWDVIRVEIPIRFY
ncbi:MAG: DUF2911 domain-containing protein [Balneolaceae bacterium]